MKALTTFLLLCLLGFAAAGRLHEEHMVAFRNGDPVHVEAGNNILEEKIGQTDLVHASTLHAAKDLDPRLKVENAATGATILHAENKGALELDAAKKAANPVAPETKLGAQLAPNAPGVSILGNNIGHCDEHPCGRGAEKVYPETKGQHDPWHLPVTPEYQEGSDHVVPEVNDQIDHLHNTIITAPTVEPTEAAGQQAAPIAV